MRVWLSILGLVLAFLSFAGDRVEIKPSLPLVTVGSETAGDWQPAGDRLEFSLEQQAHVRLWLFSPSIDVENQKGDERFGAEPVSSRFELRDDNAELVFMADFPEGPSSWVMVYDKNLAAGHYLLHSFVSGQGKNVFIPVLERNGERQAFQSFDPSVNLSEKTWQEAVRFEISKPQCRLEVYDGDGPNEVMMRLLYPGGERRNLLVPANQEWFSYEALEALGDYSLELRQPDQAYQASNALRFRVFCDTEAVALELEPSLPVEQAQSIEVLLIDVNGLSLDLPYLLEGEQERLVSLLNTSDYILRDTLIEGGVEVAEGKVRFGLEGGKVTFILEKLQALALPEVGIFVKKSLPLAKPEVMVQLVPTRNIPVPVAGTSVRLPDLHLERSMSQGTALACQVLSVRLQVSNQGQLAASYNLTETLPFAVRTLNEKLSWQGYLAPGETVVHEYQFELLSGFQNPSTFRTILQGANHLSIAETPLSYLETSASLERLANETRLYAQDEALMRYTLYNPSDQEVVFSLVPAFANLELLEGPSYLRVAAKASASADFRVRVGNEGIAAMQVSPFACDPLALEQNPSQAALIYREEVAALPSLPQTQQSSLISIDMAAYDLPVIEGLILVQDLPEGVRYISGSTFVNGLAASDPEQAGQALIFRLPKLSLANLRFTVVHEQPFLAKPEDSSLLVLSPKPELLIGNPEALELYQAAVPLTVSVGQRQRFGAVILSPLNGTLIRSGNSTALTADVPLGDTVNLFVNDEVVAETLIGTKTYDESLGRQSFDYLGISLKPGPNQLRLESRDKTGRLLRDVITVYVAGVPQLLSITPVSELLADSNHNLDFEVLVQDAWGNPPADGFIRLDLSGAEFASEDATAQQAGFQLAIKEGLGRFSLKPLGTPGIVTISSSAGKELGTERFEIKSSLRDWILVGNASLGLAYQDNVYFGLEGSAFARGRIFDTYLLTLSARYPLQALGLFGEDAFSSSFSSFPLTGSQGLYNQDAFSQHGLYARLERDQSYLQYGDFTTRLEGPFLNLSRPYTGLSGDWQFADLRLVGYLSNLSLGNLVTDLYLKADGTRVYSLPHKAIISDSLRLRVVKSDCSKPSGLMVGDKDPLLRNLKAGLDYRLDQSGILRLSFALPIQDNQQRCYYLLASYQLASTDSVERDWQFGAQALYSLAGLKLRLGAYRENGLAAAYSQVSSVGASFDLAGISTEIDLAYGQNQETAGLAASAQLAYSQEQLNAALRYSYTGSDYRSATLATADSAGQMLDLGVSYALSPELALTTGAQFQQLSQTQELSFSLSGLAAYQQAHDLGLAKHLSSQFGLRYSIATSSDSSFSALLGSSVENLFGLEKSEFSVVHQQLIFGSEQSVTNLSVAYKLLENLSLRLTNRLTWGQGNALLLGIESGLNHKQLLLGLCQQSFCEALDPKANLGETTLSAHYEVSTGIGSDAARLLFNVTTEYPLSDHLSLSLAASQISNLQDSQENTLGLSLGATYKQESLRASASYDLHFGTSFKQAFLLASTFEVNRELFASLGFDYVNDSSSKPEQGFKFGIAAAYRGEVLSLLSRQDLRFGRFASNLEQDVFGDTRLNWYPGQDWSLHSSYLYAFEPELGFRDQFSIGASALAWQGGSIAAYGRLFHQWQTEDWRLGASLELSQNLGCGINLMTGYNFFDGLSPNYGAHFGQTGPFIRLDFVFDEDWRCGEASLSGQIWLTDPHSALAGLRLELYNPQGELVASTFSTSDGSYHFKRLKPASYLLKLDLPTTFSLVSGELSQELSLGWAASEKRDFVLIREDTP